SAVKTDRSAKVAVISGRYPATEFPSPENHRYYCERHRYYYIHCNWPTGARNPYFNKIGFLRAYAELFDFLVWVDDDAFFVDFDRSLDSLLPSQDSFLSICRSPDFKALHTFVSSGSFVLRCDTRGRNFLRQLERVDLDVVQRWWRDDFGFFTHGDQDAFVYLLHSQSEYGAFDHLPYDRFNSRIENVEAGEDVFLLHLTGRPPVKREAHRRAQRYLDRGPALLPTSEGGHYQAPPSRWRRLARRMSRWVK
ncbi:MAG: hypothetical protein AAFX94_08000, partial [Myxococcota bacterium]